MKISEFEIFRYALPLLVPIKIKHHFIKKRFGYIIRITNEDGYFGYGEVAPLPGVHKEDMLSSVNQLKKLRHKIIGNKIPANLSRFEGAFENWFSDFALLPSVRFGAEMAILNLEAATYENSLFSLFYSISKGSIKLNSLIAGDPRGGKETPSSVLNQMSQILQEGYSTIKVKVGSKSISEDIELVNRIIEFAEAGIKLRLDSNRAWRLNQAIEFGKEIPAGQIEYIEEPLKSTGELQEFFQKTGIPVALDESLTEIAIHHFKPFEGLEALIIKPSVVGGFEKTNAWVSTAQEYNLDPILSCAFLSGVGLAAIANFASNLKLNHLAMGLDTFKWFRKDLPAEPVQVANGTIQVEREYEKSLKIRTELLQKI